MEMKQTRVERRRQNVLGGGADIYLSQRLIPPQQPDHKQHKNTKEKRKREAVKTLDDSKGAL